MSSTPAISLLFCLTVYLLIPANGKDIRTRLAFSQQDARKPTGNLATRYILQPVIKKIQNLRSSNYQPNNSVLRLRPADKEMPMTKKWFSWFRHDPGARIGASDTRLGASNTPLEQKQKSNSICNAWFLTTLCGLLTG